MTVESHEVVVKILGMVPDYAECEIVRCRDCTWFANSSHYKAYCTNFGALLHGDCDGFCAWGERKEGGDD